MVGATLAVALAPVWPWSPCGHLADKGGPDPMRLQSRKQLKARTSPSFYLTCVATALLFTLCGLIAACSSTADNNQVDLSNQAVTATIDLNGSNSSPTPLLPDYLCGAWVTNTSPGFDPDQPDRPISLFAKFVHTVDQNPVGVDGAIATATILWPDQSTDTATAKTTPDGLAVFSIILNPDAVNKLVLVQVTFTKDGTPPCQVPQPAYFTPVLSSSGGTQSPPGQQTPTPPGIVITPGPNE